MSAGAATTQAQTTTNGEYQFEPVWGPVAYSIQGVKAGYTITSLTGTLERDTTREITAQRKSVELIVQAFDPSLQVVAGVTVSLQGGGSAVTNAQGEARFTLPWGSQYVALLSGSGMRFPRNLISGQILGNTTRAVIVLR